MKFRTKVWLLLGVILVITIITGLISYPKGPNIKIGSYFKEIKVHLGLDLQGGTRLTYDADTSQIPEAEKISALDGVRDVIERRVNSFGISEPVVQTNKVGNQWRVIIELAGIKDVNEAIKLIGETPLLEFKEEKTKTLTEEEIKNIEKSNADQKIKAEDTLKKALEPNSDFVKLADENTQDPSNTDQSGSKKGGDLGFFDKNTMVPEFSTVVFDKLKDNEIYPELVETQFGYHIVKRTGTDGEKAKASHILFIKQSTEPTTDFANTDLSGKNLKKSTVQFTQQTNEPQVLLEFDEEGKKLFSEITERNLNKIVGIYLDGSPISMPRVNEVIREGSAVISGSFSLEEAKLLAQRLNAGALPVPITLVSQYNVGATLGKESVQKSLVAGMIGLALVAIFMIVYYRLPGLISVIALIIYSLITLSLFKLIPITLTLAGVAGYILSIGMAVDANVLIFERTREELRRGRDLSSAVEEGFRRAWLSIRDSNFSSLITCIILSWFGTSIIQGFAITLGLGILVSMFSAITITRTFLRVIIFTKIKFLSKLY